MSGGLVIKSMEVDVGISEHQKKVDAHFQEHSASWRDVYEEDSVEGAIYRKRFQIALEWVDNLALPAGEKILEIGCGGGRLAVALAQRGYVVDAIDSAPNMLAITRQHAADMGVASLVRTNLGNAHTLRFPNDNFGLVVAMGVLPYLHSPGTALDEMARAVRPGRFLLITAANRQRLGHIVDPWSWPPVAAIRGIIRRRVRRRLTLESNSKWPPMRFDSLRQLDAWLLSAGLVRLRKTSVGFPNFTFRGRAYLRVGTSLKLNHWLQQLTDRNVPVIRSTGMDYVVLARRRTGGG